VLDDPARPAFDLRDGVGCLAQLAQLCAQRAELAMRLSMLRSCWLMTSRT
jgi:hypothetical protein